MILHFRLGRVLINGQFVDQIGAGVNLGSISLSGGRSSGFLVQTESGPRVVLPSDVVNL
jgi:hypothetical protein